MTRLHSFCTAALLETARASQAPDSIPHCSGGGSGGGGSQSESSAPSWGALRQGALLGGAEAPEA